jgi:hypothetical protein
MNTYAGNGTMLYCGCGYHDTGNDKECVVCGSEMKLREVN